MEEGSASCIVALGGDAMVDLGFSPDETISLQAESNRPIVEQQSMFVKAIMMNEWKNHMSSQSSIARGPNFQLYTDVFEEATVYLELKGVAFETGKKRVKVAIPAAVWEVIRQYPGVDLSLADISDEKMQQAIEYSVQERARRYAQADEQEKHVLNLTGLFIFGSAERSRDEQIARGLEYYTQLRKRQQKIKRDISDLWKMQRQAEQPDEQ